MRSRSFESFAGTSAIAVAVGGIAYSIAFVTVLGGARRPAEMATSVFLMGGGLLATAVMVGLYGRLRDIEAGFALWALLLGVTGSMGSAIHGAYDLALDLHTPARSASLGANPVDPRGLLTFGLTALAVAVFSWLMLRGGGFPRRLAYLGFLAAVLLLVVYLGRLVVFNPKSPVLLGAAVLSGFLVNPAWFLWAGLRLRRGIGEKPAPRATAQPAPA